jgi:hypothetical protein
VLRRAVTCCETAVMQGSTSIMAEADPAVLRQPTAAEQRLDTSLKQQRSNGAACASSVAVPLVTQSSTVGGLPQTMSSLVVTDHMRSAQVLKLQRSVTSLSQMTLWDGATLRNYPACKKAQVTSCQAPSLRTAWVELMITQALPHLFEIVRQTSDSDWAWRVCS